MPGESAPLCRHMLALSEPPDDPPRPAGPRRSPSRSGEAMIRLASASVAAVLLVATAAAQPAQDPAALLRTWAAAYATNDGAQVAVHYTEDARLWGSVSREQTVGRDAITAYFARVRPGASAIDVRFGDHALREIAPGVAVASGHYTFLRRLTDGTEGQEPSRFSMVMLRGPDGAWRIVDHHSSRLPTAR